MASAVIGALRVNLGLNSAAFSRGIKQSDSKLKSFGRNVARGMKTVGIAASAAAVGVGLAVRGALNQADEMAKVSQKIGIPIDELSRLKHAADLSGVSFGGLQTAVGRLSRNMADAKEGIGEGAAAFEKLGISVTNSDGSLKSSTQVMQELSARFAAMPDGAEKTALAMELMGRSGANMIPMLNGGKDALTDMMAEADALGIVFDEKTGKAAEQFNDNLTRLGASIRGLVVQLTAALAPTLAAITDTVVRVVDGFQLLSPSTQKFIGIAAGLTVGLTALAIPLGAIVLSFGLIGAPVIAAGLAIAGLTAAVVAFWPEIQEAGKSVKQFAIDIVTAFQAIPGQMVQIGRDIIAGLWSGIQERWQTFQDDVSSIGTGIADRLKTVLRIKSPSRVMMEIGANIMQGLGIGMKNEKSDIDSTVSSIGQGISGAFDGIGASISGAIKGVKSWKDVAVDALKSVAKAIAQSALSNTDFGSGIFGSLAKGLVSGLNSFSGGGYTGNAPRTGGVDGKGGFMAIMHPRETVIDHTRAAANQNSSASRGVVLNIHQYGDDKVETQTSQGPNEEIIDVFINKSFASGRQDKAMDRFGVSPKAIKR